MILIQLSFFTSLQKVFGLTQTVQIIYGITIYELLERFCTLTSEIASEFLLDTDHETLRPEYIIMLEGKDIMGLDGLMTVLDHSCELSFFPKLAGGQ
jgi:molybdopterin converting factor small subunit